jgi:hypothetical protein
MITILICLIFNIFDSSSLLILDQSHCNLHCLFYISAHKKGGNPLPVLEEYLFNLLLYVYLICDLIGSREDKEGST